MEPMATMAGEQWAWRGGEKAERGNAEKLKGNLLGAGRGGEVVVAGGEWLVAGVGE
jgi:hypothetical protein